MTEPSLRVHALGVVGLFAVVGVGIGLATNFSLAFLIEWQVDPGANPTDNTIVGMTLVQGILFPLMVGPLVAAVAGLAAGYSVGDRRLPATVLAGLSSAVGFVAMALLSVVLTVVVLAVYAGGGGATGFPMDRLLWTVVETAIPVGVVGATAGYLGSRVSS